MSVVRGVSSSGIAVDGGTRQGWWLVVDAEFGPGRIVAGPFEDRAEASWAAGSDDLRHEEARSVYGFRRADGGLNRRPSPQEWAWLGHLGDQLDRLPEDWAAGISDEHPLATLVVELTAALAEAGLPLHDGATAVGGACLTPEPALDGVVVSWRQHDRMSLEQVHGADADVYVQRVMNQALADVLVLRGFVLETLGGAGSGASVVRSV